MYSGHDGAQHPQVVVDLTGPEVKVQLTDRLKHVGIGGEDWGISNAGNC